jgi:parallel beta-helix repeat protein
MLEQLSVLDSGARGDGIADDTVPIQKTIDSAASILFPAGTYKVSSPIRIPSNRRLHGTGQRSVLRRAVPYVGRILQNCEVAGNHNIVIEKLLIDGGRTVQAYRPLEDGIFLTRCQGCFVRSVTVKNCQNDGIIIEYGGDNRVENCTVSKNAKVGIYFSGASQSSIVENSCRDNGTSGIGVAASKNVSVVDNVCDGNKSYGITTGRDAFDCIVMGNSVSGSLYALAVVPEPLGNGVLHGIDYREPDRLYGIRRLSIARNQLGGKVALIMAATTRFEQNTCFGSNSQGILLQGSSDNAVRNNVVEQWNSDFPAIQLASLRSSDGVPALMAPPLLSRNNQVVGNKIRSSKASSSDIIDNGFGNVVRDNRFLLD